MDDKFREECNKMIHEVSKQSYKHTWFLVLYIESMVMFLSRKYMTMQTIIIVSIILLVVDFIILHFILKPYLYNRKIEK